MFIGIEEKGGDQSSFPRVVHAQNLTETRAETARIHHFEPLYVTDFSDDRKLMGASHNVFIAKVIRQTGNKERGLGPETQFEVQIVENVKGDLSGTVIVNQQGGYRNGELHLLGSSEDYADESYLLQPGKTYLLATRYNPTEEWYTLNPHPAARKLLSGSALDITELKDLALRDERVQKLKEAYPSELLLGADVINRNTRNNYTPVQESMPSTPENELDLSTASPVVEAVQE